MKPYDVAKIFVLPLMLGIYALFTATVAVAHLSGGWIVVAVDRYHEGLPELILLSSMLPVATYVTIKEVATTIRGIKESRR